MHYFFEAIDVLSDLYDGFEECFDHFNQLCVANNIEDDELQEYAWINIDEIDENSGNNKNHPKLSKIHLSPTSG